MLDENEKKYGKEVREMFGSEAVNESNKRLMGMSESQYDRVQELSRQINEALLQAFKEGDPASPLAQKVCALHREWLGFYWKNYTREAHLAMAQSYVDDKRFKAYYDSLAEGCAVFLRDAIAVYCSE